MLKLHTIALFLLTVFSYVSFLDSFIEVLIVFCSNCYSNPWVWWTNDKPSCFHPAFAKTLISSSYILLYSSITCLSSLRIILSFVFSFQSLLCSLLSFATFSYCHSHAFSLLPCIPLASLLVSLPPCLSVLWWRAGWLWIPLLLWRNYECPSLRRSWDTHRTGKEGARKWSESEKRGGERDVMSYDLHFLKEISVVLKFQVQCKYIFVLFYIKNI